MKQIAILGRSPTADMAPFQDPLWTMYGLTWDRAYYHHCHLLFDPHTKPWVAADTVVPVITRDNFPFDKLEQFADWFVCTPAYMIAYAITEKPDVIGIWGVDCVGDENIKHLEQIPCLNYWIGVAQGLGIKVYTPGDKTRLLGQERYGDSDYWVGDHETYQGIEVRS